jgi:glutaredoxin 3
MTERVMAEVEIYTTMWCGYCSRAKRLLAEHGVAFQEIDVNAQPERRSEMVTRAGGRSTVPQIFINGSHVGGCDELQALDKAGRLSPLLAASP